METRDARTKALNEYVALIREIKLRLDAIEAAINGETKLHRAFAQEFCFLQIRMICELMALACLSAHGDLAKTSPLKKKWSADDILVQLESLQPRFFPWPSRQIPGEKPGRFLIQDSDNRDDCITKDELLKLYGQCGNYVHRGTYRNIFEAKQTRSVTFETILGHCQRIVNLLDSHSVLIKRADRIYLLFCVLNAAPDNEVKGFVAFELDKPPPQ